MGSLEGDGCAGDRLRVPIPGKSDTLITIDGMGSRDEDEFLEFHLRGDQTFIEILRGLELEGGTYELEEADE